ncbi:MAG: hypothetical protein M9896_18985 [Candidatus Promineofilum sp.]|uniref:hypothetical protein n=1 Tax=Promineifilum sp. TaxID=2664178 RepID=UPI002411E8CC|nr:hypothetical protein [Promineifilum sp.]
MAQARVLVLIIDWFVKNVRVIRAGDVCDNNHGNPPISNRLLPLAGHAYAGAERTTAWMNPFHHNVFSRSSRRIDSAAPGPARRQRLKPPPATGNRLKPVRVIAGGRKTGSTVLTTYSSSGTRQSERAYYAFGDDRRTVNTPLTDHLFTGQKQDESGSTTTTRDTMIRRLATSSRRIRWCRTRCALTYNRYMYALGNPLKYNDPSGHIAVCFGGALGGLFSESGLKDSCKNCRQSLLTADMMKAFMERYGRCTTEKAQYNGAMMKSLLAMENNPDQPVIIAGYSWGGGAALELAYRLRVPFVRHDDT